MMFTQPNVPAQIREYVGGHVRNVVKSPRVRELFEALSTEPYAVDGNDAKAWIVKERERWGRVIRASGFPLR